MIVNLDEEASLFRAAVILIVEDNADNLFIVKEHMRRAGASICRGVASGRQLFALLETWEEPVHLILLDLQIPHEDGYAILARLRTNPHLGKTRVVAMTANVLADDVAQARAAGFNGFIGKPLNYHRFPRQIARILAGEEVWEAR